MSVVKNLTVPFHAADASLYDGPASAQMILEEIGGAATQAHLDGVIQAHNAEPTLWHTDPQGLSGCLNVEKPASFANHFVVFDLGTALAGSEKITYTLHHYQVATATLVFWGGVWVVVKGVQTDVDPLAGNPYTIEGFWIHNPWNAASSPAGEYVIYNPTWLGTYFTPVSIVNTSTGQTSQWNGKHVSVCDPESPKLARQVVRPPARAADGDAIMAAADAARLAVTMLERHGLSRSEMLAPALERAVPRAAELVQRLDRIDDFEYLVPFQRANAVTAIVRLDARFGTFHGAVSLAANERWPRLLWDDIRRRLGDGQLDIAGFGVDDRYLTRCLLEKRRLFKGMYCLYPSLIWVPCWESRSPYAPFYMVTVGSDRLYISSVDGTIYRRLHLFGPSGPQRPGGL